MIVRSTAPYRALAALALFAAVMQQMAIGAVNAADPPVPGPLDRPIADVALIDAGGTPEAPPLLLTLDTENVPPGTIRVALLDRSIRWQPVAAVTIALFGPTEGAETPWLVELGPRQFAILATSHDLGRTALAPVRIVPGDAEPIQVGPMTSIDRAVDDAGAIDVDGAGSAELVVSAAIPPSGDVCQGSLVRVLDGTTFAERAEWVVPEMRLAGGVLGEWDGLPGGDLLAYAYATCPAGPDSAQRLGVFGLRLADGTPIVARSPEDPTASPGVPLVADFDGDGRDEVVIREGVALVVLEPARGWARTEVARGDVMPLLAAGPEAAGRAGTLVWVDHASAGDNLVMALGGVTRTPDGSLAIASQPLDLAAAGPARLRRVLRGMRGVARAQVAPQAWRGDIDGDGCADILAPLLTAQCAADFESTVLKLGATWFAARPVVAFQAGDSRELLIAATIEWAPASGGPRPATPAAATPPGAWRHGPSPRFALSEVRAADAAYFNSFPIPRPTIERAAVRAQATDFPGFTGARVLIRVTSTRPDDPPPPDAPTLDAFLSDPPAKGELVVVDRVPVPPGAESGRDGSFVHVSLADVLAPGGGPAERWTVTIAQINDWGEIAGPVRGTIIRDSTGPSLTVDTPFLSAPWPLEATLHGRSEPGVEVRGASGGPALADRRGRFELRTQLAPWPQTVELTAIDESGNRTTRQFSFVGGVDYRAFPWPAILAVLLLLGAAFSAGRGTQRVRDERPAADTDPQPEIEELPPTGEWPRA